MYCSAKRKVLFLIRSLNTLYLVQNIPLKAVDDSLHVFIYFCYSLSLFHICLLKIWPRLNNVNHDTEKGKQWIKLGAGRDSKTAHKTSENSKKTKCESGARQETKSTYFQQRSQKLLLFSRHHFTGASYIKQRGVACICDCGFVCVCVRWKAESLLLLFFSLFCLFFTCGHFYSEKRKG